MAGPLGASMVALHGVIHVVGFFSLWELAEVGEFTDEMATPTPGFSLDGSSAPRG